MIGTLVRVGGDNNRVGNEVQGPQQKNGPIAGATIKRGEVGG